MIWWDQSVLDIPSCASGDMVVAMVVFGQERPKSGEADFEAGDTGRRTPSGVRLGSGRGEAGQEEEKKAKSKPAFRPTRAVRGRPPSLRSSRSGGASTVELSYLVHHQNSNSKV